MVAIEISIRGLQMERGLGPYVVSLVLVDRKMFTLLSGRRVIYFFLSMSMLACNSSKFYVFAPSNVRVFHPGKLKMLQVENEVLIKRLQ